MTERLIWVKTKSSNYYNFVLKLSTISIKVWEIRTENDIIYLKIAQKDMSKLKKYLPSFTFQIERYLGIDRIGILIKKYCFFIFAIIIGIGFLYLITNVIVDVDVVHSDAEIRKLVTKALEEKGIKRLTLKKDYNELTKIKKQILNDHKNQLEWLEIETHGMKYVVRVEERIITKSSNSKNSCHIIAKKSGVITKIFTEKGVANVSSGAYVSQGDILINGNILLNEEVKNTVCASGEVKAEVWYTVKVNLPLNYEKNILTGQKRYNLSFKINNQKQKIFRGRLKNFNLESTKLFSFLQVEFYLDKEFETKTNILKYSEEEALEKAIKLAIEKMNIKRKDYDRILTQKVLKNIINDSTMELEIFFAIEEDIGRVEEFEPEVNQEEFGE